MLPEEMREKAIELFLKRLHCSQVIALIGMEKLGVDDPSVIKALGAFGGGIGGTCNIYKSCIYDVLRPHFLINHSCLFLKEMLKEKMLIKLAQA